MQVERELARHHTELERLVAERTSELQRSRAQLQLTERLASIGTLAAGLGHDMNNVLMPVRARLNALRASIARGRIPLAEGRHIEGIRKSVAYLQQLADGLHFLAMDPDRIPPGSGNAATDLGRWWSQVGPLIGSAVPKHVQVAAAIERGLPPVAVAAAGLTQAALNLVVNGGEAIPPGRRRAPLLKVWAKRSGDCKAVLFGVSDNGRGMSAAVKRRAFELFFTTKARGLGTGLGLPLVRRVAEGAGGSVTIESTAGKGTTVVMRLPLAESPKGLGAGSQKARISVGDGRAAALIRHVLSSSGLRVVSDRDTEITSLWVVDPELVSLAEAKRWRGRIPTGRLVLFGAPGPRESAGWRGLGATTIREPADFDALRIGLDRALAVNR